MIRLKILKKVIDTLPISGDIVEKVETDKIIYESTRVLYIDKPVNIFPKYKVRSITHQFFDKTDELQIDIDHFIESGYIGKMYRIVIDSQKLERLIKKIQLQDINTISDQS